MKRKMSQPPLNPNSRFATARHDIVMWHYDLIVVPALRSGSSVQARDYVRHRTMHASTVGTVHLACSC